MSVLNENQLLGASGAGGDYEIEQSLRFNESSGSNLERTPAADSNRKTWTFSAWCKLGNLDARKVIFGARKDDSIPSYNYTSLYYESDGTFKLYSRISNVTQLYCITNAKFRDASAWYHIVAVIDTTQATASDRAKLYVNNELQSFSTATIPSQNYDTWVNNNFKHFIGSNPAYDNSTNHMYDGYLAEVNFIDGQALTPDSFGETGTYGEWKPKAYAGTYGTNGFYLPFEQDYTVEGFSTVTYEATQANQYIGGTGFQPDFIWFKNRTRSSPHRLVDAVRGLPNMLMTNTTGAEATAAADGTMVRTVTGFAPDGFTLGMDDGGYRVNSSTGDDIVAWSWDMGGTTASNTNGSITSSVRANTAYGQSIITHTGSGTNGDTIGHGLSQAPDFIINKRRSLAGGWFTQHVTLGPTKYLRLEDTLASTSNANLWFNTAPTSSVISIGGSCNTVSATFVTYAFHSVTGYSKFGSYSGNGSTTGPVVTLGFSPAFVIIKRSDAVEQWRIFDNTRNPTNPVTRTLNANESNAESDNANNTLNFTSTGFQLTATNGGTNASGGTYIYAAFADTREYAYWYDQSGNNNDWTSEGGLTESDVMVDSPTNNFSVMNGLTVNASTLAEGNLAVVSGSGAFQHSFSTITMTTGKWYMETLISIRSGAVMVGIADANNSLSSLDSATVGTTSYRNDGTKRLEGTYSSYGSTYAAGDIIGVAVNVAAGTVTFYKNNVSQGAISAIFTNTAFDLVVSDTATEIANFGSDSSFAGNKTPQGNQDSNGIGDFYYAPPTGFLALCTSNLPEVDVIPSENFNPVLYTGNGANNHAITGVGFLADFVWTKSRSSSDSHTLQNSVAGVAQNMSSNGTQAEGANARLSSFDTDGFTLTNNTGANGGSKTFVAWNWKAGGSASSNTNGTITSSVSANAAAGFSIVSWTGTGANATVGHGLASAPELIIAKNRDRAVDWVVQETAVYGATRYLRLNTTNASSITSIIWNNTNPTSSVFSIGTYEYINANTEDIIAYCFHSVESYSKVGSYTGNGSTDGTFVHCGFRPAYVMVKRTDASGNGWAIKDDARFPSNVMNGYLFAESSGAEGTASSLDMDFTSNGFKWRGTSSDGNASGGTYIFLAFAENPFKFSNAR